MLECFVLVGIMLTYSILSAWVTFTSVKVKLPYVICLGVIQMLLVFGLVLSLIWVRDNL